MPAARYWRAVGLCAYGGGDVELSALQLYEGGNDPEYHKVSLLMHFDGASGSTTFTDSSPSPKTVAAVGTAKVSTTQSKFGGASAVFDAVDDRIDISDHADFRFGTGDFTIEAWVYLRTSASDSIVIGKDFSYGLYWPAWGISIDSSRRLVLQVATSASTGVTLLGGVVPLAAQTHVAVTRKGTTAYLFVGGALVQSGALPQSINDAHAGVSGVSIGRGSGTSNLSPYGHLDGYVDEVRITKGVARYIENFTPPNAPFANSVAGTDAVRHDQSAVLTSTILPISGSITSLQDDNEATTVRIAAHEPGFALQWDFGAGAEKSINAAAPGAAADSALFLSHFDLQSSNDGKFWVQEAVMGRYLWPGSNTMAPPGSGAAPLLVRTPIAPTEVAASSPMQAHSTPLASRLQLARDVEHGGLGIIYGTVKEKNTPANTPLRRKVWLLDERSGLVIRETWSDAATGAYEFRGIKQGVPYTVLAYDHAHNYRAFAGDNLLPDPMP